MNGIESKGVQTKSVNHTPRISQPCRAKKGTLFLNTGDGGGFSGLFQPGPNDSDELCNSYADATAGMTRINDGDDGVINEDSATAVALISPRWSLDGEVAEDGSGEEEGEGEEASPTALVLLPLRSSSAEIMAIGSWSTGAILAKAA